MKKTLEYKANGKIVDLDISLEDGCLSICGTVWDKCRTPKTERSLISCGQCIDECRGIVPDSIIDVWEKWHLNDMNAGTVAQSECLKELFKEQPRADYTIQCEYLRLKGLLVDNGYQYGAAWLKRDLPADVVFFVQSL